MRTISAQLLMASALGFAGFAAPALAEDPVLQPLTIAKECSQYAGTLPSFCTITASNLAAIPVGTKAYYYGPVANNPNFSSNNVVLDDGAGNTAMGNCIVDFGAGPKGICAFYAGSGTLEGFMAVVHVTTSADGLWHWDGGYLIDPR